MKRRDRGPAFPRWCLGGDWDAGTLASIRGELRSLGIQVQTIYCVPTLTLHVRGNPLGMQSDRSDQDFPLAQNLISRVCDSDTSRTCTLGMLRRINSAEQPLRRSLPPDSPRRES